MSADRNLLFGILALQMDFITRDDLVQAMHAWVLDKASPLGQILVERKALGGPRRLLLEALVQEHLEQHGNDAGRSLAAVAPAAPVRKDLERIADPDVHASLARVAGRGADPWATTAPSVGESTSAGLRFHILRPHAKGGLGQVSVAHDDELHREVALKEIQDHHADNPEVRARFLLEAEITGGLEHPGIVPVYGLGMHADGRPFYVMRFIRGDSLKDAIERFHKADGPGRDPGQRTLEVRQLLGRFLDACNAIAYAHSRGVLHRDLKPANIMLGPYGETLVVDWGLAKPLGQPELGTSAEGALRPHSASGQAPTQMGSVLGTPAFMSPEQAAGRLDLLGPASDIYSLGATLYYLLAGRAPFPEREMGPLLQQVQRGDFATPRQANRKVPAALEAICLKAMSLRAEDRYPSPQALADDLEHWLADEPVAAYREPLLARLGRWRRRHATQVTAAAVLLLTALVVGGAAAVLAAREQQKTRALGRVEALLEATPSAVPVLLDGLAPANADAQARLRHLWEQEDLPDSQRRRVGLALLPTDPDRVRNRLVTMTPESEEPQELLMLRDRLGQGGGEASDGMWEEARRPSTAGPRRLRLLVALASFDPASANWPEVAGPLAELLLASNPLHVGDWSGALEPVRHALLPPLRRTARESPTTEKGVLATTILVRYAADQPAVLADLLLEASPEQHAILWPAARISGKTAAAMVQELGKTAAAGATDAARDALASRQANAAITRFLLGSEDAVWPLLRSGPDPRLRTYLIHRFAALRADPEALRRRLPAEPDASARQALFLSLGEYAADRFAPRSRQALLEQGLAAYRDDPDPGVHSAADWTLRRLGHGKELAAAKAALVAATPAASRRWLVNQEGHTMAVVPGPVVFPMRVGSGKASPQDTEILRPHKIAYSFALATRKVTLGQFRRFLRDNPDIQYPYKQPRGADEQMPATQVTWIQAARYCRWLSEQERIPPGEMCFPEGKNINEGVKLPADYLRRTGYRLPTQTEWECACRAGTTTKRAHGSADDMLKHYGWHLDNSRRRNQPAGLLKPNDLGLFDIYGTAAEWCSDLVYFSPGVEERILRGSSRFDEPEDVMTAPAGIRANRPGYRGNECAMRVARTLPCAAGSP